MQPPRWSASTTSTATRHPPWAARISPGCCSSGPAATSGSATATVKAAAWSTIRATTSTTTSCRSARRTGRRLSNSSSAARPCLKPQSRTGSQSAYFVVSNPAHPYANKRIGLATVHSKELAIAPPFRRLLDANVVVAPEIDTDSLGTFSGEIQRNDELTHTAVIKAEMAFATLDVDCALAR